tara:strand:+ start:540 stop:2480 length:1941 start_codon:yes stop_codon:yes gene_type:complete
MSSVFQDRTYIPDDNFEQAIIDLGFDDVLDDYVLTSNINEVGGLGLISKNISDLTGIEGFRDLLNLDLSGNNLSFVDLSKNKVLRNVNLSGNQFKSIDLTKNIELESLKIDNNYLTELDVSKNIELSTLQVDENNLKEIDVSNNIGLGYLTLINNSLTKIDVRNNLKLSNLRLDRNEISEIDVKKNINLKRLSISYNNISSIDISKNKVLEILNLNFNNISKINIYLNINLNSLRISNNKLDDLDVTNNLDLTTLDISNTGLAPAIDVSKNFGLVEFDLTSNPDLECVKVNQGQLDITFALWYKDANTTYALSCDILDRTYVPDDNFEESLIEMGYDDAMDDYVLTNDISSITIIDLNGRGIIETTGIEDFVSLNNLNFENNRIKSIDLFKNTNLKEVNFSRNLIEDIDISENKLLEKLNLNDNLLSEIELSYNPRLKVIDISNNNFESIDISSLNLTNLNLSNNKVENIELRNHEFLNFLDISNNKLGTLNVSNNIQLENLNSIQNLSLECIDVSKTQINNIPKEWKKDTYTRYSIDCSNKNLISYQVEIYNAISPNGNDKNDFFFIKNADKYSNNSLKIFDRNGIIVYEENGYGIDNKLFYGKSNINNSNNTLPSGSYFYVFSYLDPSLQETIVKKGVLTLINN